jgi:hypothetical protein
MGGKIRLGSKKRAALIGAAVLPAASAMLAHQANAAPTLTVTNLGPTTTGASFTSTGFTSFLVSVTADSGQVITAMDLGSASNPTNGIFGQFLQRWTANTYDRRRVVFSLMARPRPAACRLRAVVR